MVLLTLENEETKRQKAKRRTLEQVSFLMLGNIHKVKDRNFLPALIKGIFKKPFMFWGSILGWGCFWEPQNSGWEPLKASQHACAALLGLPPQPFGNMSLRGVEVAGGARVVGRGWSGGGTWGQ